MSSVSFKPYIEKVRAHTPKNRMLEWKTVHCHNAHVSVRNDTIYQIATYNLKQLSAIYESKDMNMAVLPQDFTQFLAWVYANDK